jgi:hypothetical protein
LIRRKVKIVLNLIVLLEQSVFLPVPKGCSEFYDKD